MLICAFPAIQSLKLASSVSTTCDDLADDLNKLRLHSFSDEVDEQVSKLERALQKCNHGQGIGFSVGGVVLTKKILFIILVEIIAGLFFIVPLVFHNSALASSEADGATYLNGDTMCPGMSASQLAALDGVVQLANISCTYNVAVGPGGVTMA
eukprot:COSAG01_NODE_16227_length_1257_cov_2.039724_1_plen_153_part_00